MQDEHLPELWEWAEYFEIWLAALQEPETVFKSFREDWSLTTLPAFEGAWCAFQQSESIGRQFDLRIRQAFFYRGSQYRWTQGHLRPCAGSWISQIVTAARRFIVPLAVLSGILLLHHSAWGYLLTSVFVLKAIALGLAVSAMVVNMTLAGIPEGAGIAIPFLVITVINFMAAVSIWKNVQE